MKATFLPALAIVLFAACSDMGHWDEHISWVSTVVVPDTVYAGVEFEVVIHAHGGFENSRVGREEVTTTETGIQITPYDWEYYPDGAKNKALQVLVHTVPLTWEKTGTVRVEVYEMQFTNPEGYSVQKISKDVAVVAVALLVDS